MHMQIKRTASAGVLLELDGVKLLLDGVCGEVKPYLPTPAGERAALLEDPPDVVAFTHCHADHYDEAFASAYLEKAAGPVMGPADIPFCRQESLQVGGVRITAVESRHLGKSDGAMHCSYVIEGSQCIWFLGDAAPAQWRKRTDLPKPDVLLAPYPYATGSAWQLTKSLGAKTVVLLHLPNREADCYGLWNAVEQATSNREGVALLIPQIGERISL